MIFNKTALALGIASTLILASCGGKDPVPEENLAPTMQISKEAGIYSVNAVDPEGDTLTYAWLIGGISYSETSSFDPSSMSLTGTKMVTVQVTDSANNVVTKEVEMEFGSTVTPDQTNTLPSVSAGSDMNVVKGVYFSLSAIANDADEGDTLSYSWSISDGQTPTGRSNIIVIDTVGVFTATITVTDNHRGSSTDTVSISVTAEALANTPPSVNAGFDKTVIAGEEFSLDAETFDADDDSLEYTWSINGQNFDSKNTKVTLAVANDYIATFSVTDGVNT
ncbi:MAG: hypothetical protein HRU38_22810, partial [Saccharospirillaceae bacterium]|nr:hypothetical protein [Saccharospirillaceae bacterium]